VDGGEWVIIEKNPAFELRRIERIICVPAAQAGAGLTTRPKEHLALYLLGVIRSACALRRVACRQEAPRRGSRDPPGCLSRCPVRRPLPAGSGPVTSRRGGTGSRR